MTDSQIHRRAGWTSLYILYEVFFSLLSFYRCRPDTITEYGHTLTGRTSHDPKLMTFFKGAASAVYGPVGIFRILVSADDQASDV